MLLNQGAGDVNVKVFSLIANTVTAISTSKVLLVPYCDHHVSRYHEWMQDPEIQEATASEPLTLEQERAMQQSWRKDPDKLTFILCRPAEVFSQTAGVNAGIHDFPEAMIGDVNMFISLGEDSTGHQPSVIGELELMIAERVQQHKGSGKAALLSFLMYVLHHETAIIKQYWNDHDGEQCPSRFTYFSAKIGKGNHRSLALFDSLGFERTSEEPNYWDEYELRHTSLTIGSIETLMAEKGIRQYAELDYGKRYL